METMRFINPTDKPVSLNPIGLGVVGPGDVVDVPLDFAAPGKNANGSRAKSTIEQVAPQMRPANEDEALAWSLLIPADPEPRSLPVTIAGRSPGTPPGVAALRAQREEAARRAASDDDDEPVVKAPPVKQSTKPVVKIVDTTPAKAE